MLPDEEKDTSIFFTSDEHYGHTNIIKYCNRPFTSIQEMDNILIQKHNEVVGKNDIVWHLGDFTLSPYPDEYSPKLNGKQFYIKGSHDKWLKQAHEMYEVRLSTGQTVILCHYAMRIWPKQHYGTWHLFGHSHGTLKMQLGKSMDVGVDTNNFYPYSEWDIIKKMESLPDNPNLIKKE